MRLTDSPGTYSGQTGGLVRPIMFFAQVMLNDWHGCDRSYLPSGQFDLTMTSLRPHIIVSVRSHQLPQYNINL